MKILLIMILFSMTLLAAEKLSLQLLWKHQFEFAGFYIAKEKGYYKDAGLDVEIREYDFSVNIVDDVLAKKTDISIARSSVILDKMQGKDVVFLNALYQSSPYILIAKERPDLQTLKDFKNKKIMLSDDLASIAAISAMMKVGNIQQDDYRTLAHTFNIDDLVDGNTDLMTAYSSNEPYKLEKEHIKYRKFDPKNYGFDFYADILFTSNDFLKKNKKAVEKFQKASIQGWNYAFSHIDETIELILTKYNTQHKSREALEYEAKVLKKLAYQDGTPFGNINEQRVIEIANVYRLLGMSNRPNTFLKDAIYKPVNLLDSIKSIVTWQTFFILIFILLSIALIVWYRHYVLKKQNRVLEKRVNEKTKELQEINAHLEQTVRKRTYELELASSAKSDFLANMSHEIRTPLNAIVGFVDILYKKESDSKKRSRLEIIKESSNSLLMIINDILDFSKLEKEKLVLEHVVYDVPHVFEYVVELFFDKAKEKDIKIRLNIDKKLPKQSMGDETRLKQVFSNLMSNAIKFSYENTQIVVNVKYLEESNKLYCEVIDNGPGIEAEKVDTIFNSFEQADSSTSRLYGGTGLGLSISKKLIYLMGGDINVTSEVNKGSKFFFTIQLFEVKEQKEEEQHLEHNTSEILSGHILIVEDNKTNQMLLKLLLDEYNLSYDTANNGLEAIKKVKQSDYNLILMDENMPLMNGIEATEKISKLDGKQDIPIVAVTANALKGDKEKFIGNGMVDYISKPIDSDNLDRILRKYLQG